MNPVPPPDEILKHASRHLGQEIWLYDQLDSTNSAALALGNDSAQDGLVILAREQSLGRGQYGRTWQAPIDSSVLMSLLLFPPPPLRRPALLTSWAAVGVCEAIRLLTGQFAQIKWPNDVYLAGKKICGILIEQQGSGSKDPVTVVGIGLNVTQTAKFFFANHLPLGGSLLSQTGKHLRPRDVAEVVLDHLDGDYQPLLDGKMQLLEMAWKTLLGLLGQEVIIEGTHFETMGKLLDVTLAAVVVENSQGELVSLIPESIRHIKSCDVGCY